jgi:hypothetical protein
MFPIFSMEAYRKFSEDKTVRQMAMVEVVAVEVELKKLEQLTMN